MLWVENKSRQGKNSKVLSYETDVQCSRPECVTGLQFDVLSISEYLSRYLCSAVYVRAVYVRAS